MGRPPQPSRTAKTGTTRPWAVVLLALLGLAAPVGADTWVDSHDAPATAWLLDTENGARRLAQERVRVEGPRKGEQVGAERIAYVAPPGGGVLAWRTVPPAAILDELTIEVEGRTTLPGVRVIAEVMVPTDSGEKKPPVRLRLRSEPAPPGAKGDFVLRLDDLPRRLQREARVWRVANRGKSIDTRNAYVSRVAIALPGSGRPAQTWVRDLRINTIVTPLRRTEDGLTETVATAEDAPKESKPTGGRIEKTRVTLRGDGFRIDGELYFPRIWRWRGEPLATLAGRGITTVWVDTLPTPQLLAEAAHHRLRVLCPPPKSAAEAASVRTWDRVLAWVLPRRRDANDLDAGLVEVEDARALGPDTERPVLAHVVGGIDAWSRVADGLLIEQEVSRVSPADADRTARGSPNTPSFAVIPLDVGQRLTTQLDSLLGDGVATTWLPPGDVSRSIHSALRSGSLGVAFKANERLDGADEATLAAAGWVEAVNRRLRLIEPWIVGPRTQRPNPASPDALVLDRQNVRLLARNSLAPATVGQLGPLDGAARVLRMTPAGLTVWSLAAAKSAPESSSRGGDLLVCNDPRILRSLRQYTAQTAIPASASLMRLAEQRLRDTQALTPEDQSAASGLLSRARLAMTRRDAVGAYDASHAVIAILADAEDHRRAIARGDLLQSNPLTVLPGILTDHFRLEQLLAASPRGPNRLHGGSFEDIDALRRDGWRRPSDTTNSGLVELSEGDTVHGDHFLRLVGKSARGGARILTPSIELAAGETLEITGWVRVTEADPTGMLMIGDSLGGPELDLIVTEPTTDWKPFRLLRATNADTELTLSLSTRGRLTAEIDGVMVRAVQPLGVARRPARTASKPPGSQAK